jgi:hypothetical protein
VELWRSRCPRGRDIGTSGVIGALPRSDERHRCVGSTLQSVDNKRYFPSNKRRDALPGGTWIDWVLGGLWSYSDARSSSIRRVELCCIVEDQFAAGNNKE